MAQVINLYAFVPPPRYDGVVWTQAKIGEAAVSTGPFTTIQTFALNPLDTNPREPMPRDFTTSLAQLTAGWYNVTFLDGSGNVSAPSDPVQNIPSVLDQIRPSLADVATLLHNRTIAPGSGGQELNTFNSTTRPTDLQAEALINTAVTHVIMKVGPNIAPQYFQVARTVILYLVAMLVEMSFYGEEVSRNMSPYPMFKDMYTDSLEGLIDSIEGDTAASGVTSFFTVPIVNSSQAHFQAILAATDPVTGKLDPTKLPPDMDYPNGIAGLPLSWYQSINGSPYGLDPGSSFLTDY